MIRLKGVQSGIMRCVVPEDLNEKKMLEEFDELTDNCKNLLDGSSVIIDMQGRQFTPALVGKIWKSFIEPAGCIVISWVVSDFDTERTLRRIGIKTGEPEMSFRPDSAGSKSGSQPCALLYTTTLRSGQKIEHDGDVIIAGHVNTGAEVYAKGHVVVLGRLKGIVHAGCGGDHSASVSIRVLESGQIRIGGKVGLIDKSSDIWKKSVVATVSGDEVLLVEWPAI